MINLNFDMKQEINNVFESIGINVKNYSKIDTYLNKVYRVKTDKGNFYLKIYETLEEKKVALKLSKLYPLLLKKGIPVPKVIKFDDSLNLIKFPYLVITEVEGEMLCDKILLMSNEEKISFYHDFGITLGKIHTITFNQFGETFDLKTIEPFIEANDKGPFKIYKEMHKEIVDYRLEYFKDTYFEDLINPIKNYFSQNSHLIDYVIVPRLLHIDLNQKNIFVKDNKISGIIDFDGAFIGHNEEELMRIEGANFATDLISKDAFFKGYTKIIQLDRNYDKRRVFYYLSRLLVNIDCLIKYKKDYVDDIDSKQEILKQEIYDILEGKKIKFDKNS